MQHSRDQDLFVVLVGDDVAFDHERAHAHSELGPGAPHGRLFHEQNLLEILLGQRRQPIRPLRLPGAGGSTFRLHPVGELSSRSPVVGTPFAVGQLIEPCQDVGAVALPRLVAFLQEPERLPDDFPGRLVRAALDLLVHRSFQLWRQRDIPADLASHRAQRRYRILSMSDMTRSRRPTPGTSTTSSRSRTSSHGSRGAGRDRHQPECPQQPREPTNRRERACHRQHALIEGSTPRFHPAAGTGARARPTRQSPPR